MRSRIVPIVIFVCVLLVGYAVGRTIILPFMANRAHTVAVQRVGTPADGRLATAQPAVPRLGSTSNQTPFHECMTTALARRVDPVEARHTCNVIADSI